MTSALRRFFSWQVRLSKALDARFFQKFCKDGNTEFTALVREMLEDGSSVADIGGGKTPMFSPGEVADRRLAVTGVDIDAGELASAPPGSYARVVVGPIENVKGEPCNDFVVAQSVMEHVQDGRLAVFGLASFARPGALVTTFCPCRRAWFARLNLLLPEGLKRSLLFSVFPEKRERQGFPAHYSGCTPAEMVANMRDAGVDCVEVRLFFVSSYFMFFVPLYLFWRLATLPFMTLWPNRYCETFIFIGRKSGVATAAL